jgi:8-oxo-dGTP pyrophosphatase MutT (NUDIX family)
VKDDLRRRLFARPSRVIDGDFRWASVAAVFRPGPGGLELLFIRRAQHPDDPWSGQIGFPGGRAEPDDADLFATAERETREEIGFDVTGRALGALDDIQARARTAILPLVIRPHAYFVEQGPITFPAVPNGEVDDAFWVPVEDLADPARRIWYDSERLDIPYRFPAIDLGPGRTLWGLTHRMVLEVQERLGHIASADEMSVPIGR